MIVASREDLPTPFRPMTERLSPGATAKSTFSSTTVSP